MPELAELRLTADYINDSVDGLSFISVDKNPQHKCEDLEIPFKNFNIKAKSRGKEIVVSILDCYSDESIPIRITMGMSGYFSMTNTGNEAKHAHLKFNTTDGTTLSFVDVRRFGKWKQGVHWNDNRGPDPTTEFEEFKENINKNIHKASFNKPIYETLMDQKFFNGIGNYLRAEILYRIPTLNPNTSGRDALESHPIILELCRDIPMMAYQKGGGSIKDWKNPFPNESNERFFICYGVKGMAQIVDRNGRRFWFDTKWLQ
jgi:endonuclease VIII-like 1|tara:strand:- start:1005 stop:1784 length:780 start_codon:yes stop_codon:yes gene_type:complete